jgi:hypothetical protein
MAATKIAHREGWHFPLADWWRQRALRRRIRLLIAAKKGRTARKTVVPALETRDIAHALDRYRVSLSGK